MNKRLEELTKRHDQITAQIQALKARAQAAEHQRNTRRKILLILVRYLLPVLESL